MKRENGFYWVKSNGIWKIAEFIDKSWKMIVTDYIYTFYDFDFEEIDESRIINPNEQ